MSARIKALDLFAGTGWGVACQRLGIKEAGVEIMPEAVATRTANGMETIYRDVWDGLQLTAEQHRDTYGSYRLTTGEAATLQSYERPFVWCGTKGKKYLQIGNAVPPLLAEHILAALIGVPVSEVAA